MIQKIAKSTLLAATLILVGCGDNAYDGTNLIGSASTQAQGDALASLQKEVFTAHADKFTSTLNDLKTLSEGFDSNLTSADVSTLQGNVQNIILAWKSVESSYVAADYDKTLIDLPQLIDFYHTGKKLDVPADIDNALIQTNISIENALFKNSSKSITALEYLTYGHTDTLSTLSDAMNKDSRRRVEAIILTTNTLLVHAEAIASFYKNDSKFQSDAKDASNSIVNVLIDSSFKLKEWRLGEPSGIALKYKDSPDPARLEYAKSRLSLAAIKTILTTHLEIMGTQSYANFGSFASDHGAALVVTQIEKQLNDALAVVNQFSTALEDSITTSSYDPKIDTLYDMVKNLQELYFTSLIQALDLTAEIIEADGD